jgi:hypothetical protein
MTRHRLSVVIDDDRDADIWRWWQQQANKSAAARAAMRAVLEPEPAPLTATAVRQIVREELARVDLLAQSGERSTAPQVAEDVNPEAAARLDALF